jgi:lactoylglutathione lyase
VKFRWATIFVKDMEASLSFWRDLIGLPVHHRIKPNPGMDIAFLGKDGTQVELLHDSRASAKTYGDGLTLGFEAPDLEETIASLKARGIEPKGPFQPNPRMRFIFITDPDGVTVQLIQDL